MKPIIGIGYNLGNRSQENYIQAIEMAGGIPVLIPPIDDFQAMLPVIDNLNGFLLTGGLDVNPELYGENPKYGLGPIVPKRDSWEMQMMDYIYNHMAIPIFGICRGFQLMNVYFGGSLFQDLKKEKPGGLLHWLIDFPVDYPSHEIMIKEDTKMHHIFKKTKIRVNSFHHQGVKILADNLMATSYSEDELIESFETLEDRFVLAVQYHPESMVKEHEEQLNLFKAFVSAC